MMRIFKLTLHTETKRYIELWSNEELEIDQAVKTGLLYQGLPKVRLQHINHRCRY